MDKKERKLMVDLLGTSGLGEVTSNILLHMCGLGEIPFRSELSRRT